MHRIDTKGDKSIAFILGLVYGYRQAQFELKVLSLEDFRKENHREDKIYYINRQKGELYQDYTEDTTHIYAVREDKINGKVWLFVYKRKVK